MSLPITATTPAQRWSGRVDGTTEQDLRWHQVVEPYSEAADAGACVLIGFASDAGVHRNQGRRGAAAGPDVLRRALSSLALAKPLRVYDAGTVRVDDDCLESGQEALGAAVRAALDSGHFPIVLGGGHEVAFGSYLGLAGAALRSPSARVGILNLDAHFDLRPDPVPSSGTPFRQIIEAERARETALQYSVIGISQPSNTAALFETAERFGVRYLLDEDCGPGDPRAVHDLVDDFVSSVDLVYLTIDLDVLPAAIAPGVSAPAAYGVPLETIQSVTDRIAASGKLALCDIAELNPAYDLDNRTARTAARLIHRIATRKAALS